MLMPTDFVTAFWEILGKIALGLAILSVIDVIFLLLNKPGSLTGKDKDERTMSALGK